MAYEKPQSALRAFTTGTSTTGTSVRFFSGTFCPPLELLRNSFIAAVKTSHTTRTLDEVETDTLIPLVNSFAELVETLDEAGVSTLN